MEQKNHFSAGVIIYFRILDANNHLACAAHLTGRQVIFNPAEDYNFVQVMDEEGNLLGAYTKDWIAGIVPIKTIGPAADANSSK